MKQLIPLYVAGCLIACALLTYIFVFSDAEAAPENQFAGAEKPTFRADWITAGGDLGATGYVPGKLGSQRFGDAAWTFSVKGMHAPTDLVVSGGKAYFFATTKNPNTGVEVNGIVAVDVATGKTDWAWNDRPGNFMIGIQKGFLYAVVGEDQLIQLICVSLKDGKAKWRKDLQSIGKESFLTSKGILWNDGNIHLSGFDKGEVLWDAEHMLMPMDLEFVMSGDDICLIGFSQTMETQLARINANNGKDLSSFELPDGPRGGSSTGKWCSGGKLIYGSRIDELVCADPKKGALIVRKTGTFLCRPAHTTGAIYALDNGVLRVLKPDTLESSGEFNAATVKKPTSERKTSPLFGQPVVTDDVIFAGTSDSTLLLSRDKLELVQEVSSGTLPIIAGNALFTWKPANPIVSFEHGPSLVAAEWTLTCHLLSADGKGGK